MKIVPLKFSVSSSTAPRSTIARWSRLRDETIDVSESVELELDISSGQQLIISWSKLLI